MPSVPVGAQPVVAGRGGATSTPRAVLGQYYPSTTLVLPATSTPEQRDDNAARGADAPTQDPRDRPNLNPGDAEPTGGGAAPPPPAATATPAPAAVRTPTFIQSEFCSKAEYLEWLATRGGEASEAGATHPSFIQSGFCSKAAYLEWLATGALGDRGSSPSEPRRAAAGGLPAPLPLPAPAAELEAGAARLLLPGGACDSAQEARGNANAPAAAGAAAEAGVAEGTGSAATAVQVHGGMLKSWQRIRWAVLKFVTEQCLGGPGFKPVRRIVVTGHSLGGGIAALLTLDILRLLQPGAAPSGPTVELFTFGSPRCGNAAFAEAFAGATVWRVVNPSDIVPRVPSWKPWKHVGVKVRIRKGDGTDPPAYEIRHVNRNSGGTPGASPAGREELFSDDERDDVEGEGVLQGGTGGRSAQQRRWDYVATVWRGSTDHINYMGAMFPSNPLKFKPPQD